MKLAAEVKAAGVGTGDVWDEVATRDLLTRVNQVIVERTVGGVSAGGDAFAPYQTPGYGDTAAPDLRDTGAMLGSIRITSLTKTGGTIACTLRHPRAVFVNRSRPFMGLLVPEAEAALRATDDRHDDRLAEKPTESRRGLNLSAISAIRGTGDASSE